MKNILIGILMIGIVAAAVVVGLKWIVEPKPHSKWVVIVEATKSVKPEAQAEAIDATEKSADVMQRGDEMVVIPLTGDAATEAPGKVLRFRMSEKREAFDADLKKTKKQIHEGLERLKNETAAKPFMRSDLLGTVRIAAEEKPKGVKDKFTLTILSDFVNDTHEISFMTSPHLANEESAKKLAVSLMKGKEKMWSGARIFLGQLRSNDLKKLNNERREAIRAFWMEFFKAGGAAEVVWATDGAGQLEDFLRREQKGG